MGSAKLSVGYLLHSLLSCSQAEEHRDFLFDQPAVRHKLFTALQHAGGFAQGSVEACAGDVRVARLVACLALQTAAAGALAQAKLLQHICSHTDAYLRLLLPHITDGRVASVLGLLAACGTEEDVLLDGTAARSYLRMLTQLSGRLAAAFGAVATECCTNGSDGPERLREPGSPGSGAPSAMQRAVQPAVQQQLAEWLTTAFTSMVNVTAAIETEAQNDLAARLVAGKRGKRLSAEQLLEAVEAGIREELPVEDIAAAIGTSHHIAAHHMRQLLQHSHSACSPLVVSMLQLDLLSGRLPPKKQLALESLVSVVHSGQTLGHCLSASLAAVLQADRHSSSSLWLLQVLSTSKAAVRCLKVAADSGLRLVADDAWDSSAAMQRRFAHNLLCAAYPGANNKTVLQLLCQLAVHHAGISTAAARRACDLVLWALATPLQHLRESLLAPALAALSAAELAQHLSLLAGGSSRSARLAANTASPFCLELGQAVLDSCQHMQTAGPSYPPPDDLAELQRALSSMWQRLQWQHSLEAAQRQSQATTTEGAAGRSALDGLSKGQANLDALDGLPPQPSAALMPPPGFEAPPAVQSMEGARSTATQAQPHQQPPPEQQPRPLQQQPASDPAHPALHGAPPPAAAVQGSSEVASDAARSSVADRQRRLELLKQQLLRKRAAAAAAVAAAAAAVAAAADVAAGSSAAGAAEQSSAVQPGMRSAGREGKSSLLAEELLLAGAVEVVGSEQRQSQSQRVTVQPLGRAWASQAPTQVRPEVCASPVPPLPHPDTCSQQRQEEQQLCFEEQSTEPAVVGAAQQLLLPPSLPAALPSPPALEHQHQDARLHFDPQLSRLVGSQPAAARPGNAESGSQPLADAASGITTAIHGAWGASLEAQAEGVAPPLPPLAPPLPPPQPVQPQPLPPASDDAGSQLPAPPRPALPAAAAKQAPTAAAAAAQKADALVRRSLDALCPTATPPAVTQAGIMAERYLAVRCHAGPPTMELSGPQPEAALLPAHAVDAMLAQHESALTDDEEQAAAMSPAKRHRGEATYTPSPCHSQPGDWQGGSEGRQAAAVGAEGADTDLQLPPHQAAAGQETGEQQQYLQYLPELARVPEALWPSSERAASASEAVGAMTFGSTNARPHAAALFVPDIQAARAAAGQPNSVQEMNCSAGCRPLPAAASQLAAAPSGMAPSSGRGGSQHAQTPSSRPEGSADMMDLD